MFSLLAWIALGESLLKQKKKGATRRLDLLEIIHIDISGPLTPTICVGKMIKIVRFDCGGEYYGKYDVIRQYMGPFTLYLQDCAIAP
ncbi:hypothetical protein CR513_37804, partial [Mucuna pruriens]